MKKTMPIFKLLSFAVTVQSYLVKATAHTNTTVSDMSSWSFYDEKAVFQ